MQGDPMKKTAMKIVLVAFIVLTLLSACGLKEILDREPVLVTITPDIAHVVVKQSIQFTADVFNSTNGAVTWTLSGTGCSGAACGTLGDSGLYSAPATVPNPATVTVKATSVADTSKWASAEVTIIPDINLWAWISGSDEANQGSVYGTKGVSAPTNIPGSRATAASWIDSQDRLWLFGGTGLNDLWQFDPATFEWTWESGGDTYFQGGNYGIKGIPSLSNFPGARGGAASWAAQGLLWLFGGTGLGQDWGYSGTIGSLNDLWTFSPATLEWAWVAGGDSIHQPGIYGTKGLADPSNVIGSRYDAATWLDPLGKVWVFGGRGRDSIGFGDYSLNDLWTFDPTSFEWTWMSGSQLAGQAGTYGTLGQADISNIPGARYGAISWVDPQGRLWLFGGQGLDSASQTGCLNDLWMYDPETSEWTWVTGSNMVNQPGVYGIRGTAAPSNFPGARSFAASWSDSGSKFWLFGGASISIIGDSTKLNDFWEFDLTTLQWTWVSGSNGTDQVGSYGTRGIVNWLNSPGARAWAVPWFDSGGNLWLFGGGGFSSTGMDGGLNDLWKYVR